MMVVFSALDFLFLNFLGYALGIQVEYNSAHSSELVFNLDDSHFHKKGSHGSSGLVCSGLVGFCWV